VHKTIGLSISTLTALYHNYLLLTDLSRYTTVRSPRCTGKQEIKEHSISINAI